MMSTMHGCTQMHLGFEVKRIFCDIIIAVLVVAEACFGDLELVLQIGIFCFQVSIL